MWGHICATVSCIFLIIYHHIYSKYGSKYEYDQNLTVEKRHVGHVTCPYLQCRSRPHGPLTRYVNCELRMRRECRECFHRHRLQRKPLVSNPGMDHGTCTTHVPWCMSGSQNPRWWEKHSQHSRRMCNRQYYVSIDSFKLICPDSLL